jgi:biopolymer transport protein ExbD
MNWYVRREGAPQAVLLPDAHAVVRGLEDGLWDATDEVQAPGESQFRPIESHPVFEQIVEDMQPPPPPPQDDSHLDMNPLIDVALVLLIFFILTTTYESLRRTIDLPPEPNPEDGAAATVQKEQILDRTFEVTISMNRGVPVVMLQGAAVPITELEARMTEVVRSTGRKELYAKVADDVPWGVETKLYDAAKAAKVTQIYWPKGK